MDQNTLDCTTGQITTIECSTPTKTYTIYTESSSGANGTVYVRVIPRTYPTSVSIVFNDAISSNHTATVDSNSGHL